MAGHFLAERDLLARRIGDSARRGHGAIRPQTGVEVVAGLLVVFRLSILIELRQSQVGNGVEHGHQAPLDPSPQGLLLTILVVWGGDPIMQRVFSRAT